MIPSSCIALYCPLVVGCKFISIVLSDVPASEPLSPFCANTARAFVVSRNDKPSPEATGATIESPYFNSWTSVAEAFAAPASWFAACVAFMPSRLNAFKAVEVISAASFKSSSPAVAKLSDAVRPPFRMSCVETPAFASSPTASAASAAEKAVSAPALIAASLNFFIVSSLSPVTALILLILASNSAAFETVLLIACFPSSKVLYAAATPITCFNNPLEALVALFVWLTIPVKALTAFCPVV